MTSGPELRTERLLLRRWQDADREPFAALNADPAVTEFLPSPITRSDSDAMVDRIEAGFDENGFGLWAAEVPGVAAFVGFVGLSRPRFDAHFTPAVEVGWRLSAEHWGNGYATEGGQATLAFGFEVLDLDEIVSFTTVGNARSRAVMERLGLSHDPADDFDHPALAAGSPLRPHVLYRIGQDAWQ